MLNGLKNLRIGGRGKNKNLLNEWFNLENEFHKGKLSGIYFWKIFIVDHFNFGCIACCYLRNFSYLVLEYFAPNSVLV